MEVHFLVCGRDAAMAAAAARSLVTANPVGSGPTRAAPVTAVLHDDGSLRADDVAALTAAVPGCRVIGRAEADDIVLPRLANLPACRAARDRHPPLMIKLIDLAVTAAGGDLAFCDSDVLFLRPVRGLFDLAAHRTPGLFMLDVLNGFACNPRQTVGRQPLRLVRRLNSGLFAVRRDVVDLDFVEHTLARHLSGPRVVPHLIEQTCWSALAARAGCRIYDPQQIVMVTDHSRLDGEHVAAGHFASTHGRHRWADGLALAARSVAPSTEPVAIRSIPARPLRPWEYVVERGLLKLRRAVRRRP